MLNHQRVHSFQAKTLSNGIQQVKGCILERWHVHCSYLITNYLWYILVNDAHTFYLPASKITFFQSFFNCQHNDMVENPPKSQVDPFHSSVRPLPDLPPWAAPEVLSASVSSTVFLGGWVATRSNVVPWYHGKAPKTS